MIGAFGDVPDPDKVWAGWLCILFFGACAVVALRQLCDRADQIVVDAAGLHWRRWSPDTIPWHAIAAIDVRRMQRQNFLCVHLVDRGRYPSTKLMGKLGGMNRSLGFGDVAVNTSGTDKSFDQLRDAVVRFRSNARYIDPRSSAPMW